MSTGTIAGMSAGIVVAVLIAAVLIVVVVKRARRTRRTSHTYDSLNYSDISHPAIIQMPRVYSNPTYAVPK